MVESNSSQPIIRVKSERYGRAFHNVTTQPTAREGHLRRTQCRCDNPELDSLEQAN
jgi:hypothetical protein